MTFGRRLLDSVLLSDFVLDLFVHAHGFLSWPSLGPPPEPPLQSDPFCVDGLTQDGHLSVRSGPGPLLGSPAAIYCSQNVAVRAVSLESLSEFVCTCGAVAFYIFNFS